MPRLFDGTDDFIRTLVPSGGNVGYGSFAAILRCTSFAASRSWMRFQNSGGSNLLGVSFNTSGQIVYSNAAAAPAGVTRLTSGEWYCIIAGKANGTTTPRVHIYRYSNDSWVHENTGASIANATSHGTGGKLTIGARQADQFMPGDIAVAAFWNRNLSDAECEYLPFSLMNWFALSPTGIWVLDQSDVSQNVQDASGNGGQQSAITGTAVSTENAPVFSYYGSQFSTYSIASFTAYDRSVAGDMPASSGVVTRLSALNRTTSGNMPASTGVISRLGAYLRSVAGNMPASTGIISRVVTYLKSVSGNLPSATSTVVRVLAANRTVLGDMPASSGILSRLVVASRSLAGNMPSATGVVDIITGIYRLITGDMPAFTGTIARNFQGGRDVAGIMPNATGIVVRLLSGFRSILGELPESSGIVSRIGVFSRSISGEVSESTGDVSRSKLTFRTILGELPAAIGSIIAESAGQLLTGRAVITLSVKNKATITLVKSKATITLAKADKATITLATRN